MCIQSVDKWRNQIWNWSSAFKRCRWITATAIRLAEISRSGDLHWPIATRRSVGHHPANWAFCGWLVALIEWGQLIADAKKSIYQIRSFHSRLFAIFWPVTASRATAAKTQCKCWPSIYSLHIIRWILFKRILLEWILFSKCNERISLRVRVLSGGLRRLSRSSTNMLVNTHLASEFKLNTSKCAKTL